MAKGDSRKDATLWGLLPSSFSRTKRWQVPSPEELDWLGRPLTASELNWLSRFNLEFHGGGPKKGEAESLHSTDELRKDCYAKTNASNRCAMSKGLRLVLFETNDQNPIDGVLRNESTKNHVEDALIKLIDELKRKRKYRMKKAKQQEQVGSTLSKPKAIGFAQRQDGQWVSYIVTLQDDGLFELESGTPNNRTVAMSEAQALFANTFIL